MKSLRSLFLGWLLPVVMSAPAMAHHSTAAYDLSKDEVIEGVVEEYHWTNPHGWIKVVAPDAAGNSKSWNIEFGAPTISIRMGWTPTSLKPGDHATFVFKPRRDGSPDGALAMVLLPDGRRLPGMVQPSGPLPAIENKQAK